MKKPSRIIEHLTLPIEQGIDLHVQIYHPDRTPDGDPVILTHGYLSSSDSFDTPDAPQTSLARFLQDRNLLVITFDQRAAGKSSGNGQPFGLRDLALDDLASVIRFTLDRTGSDRIHLGGHSLGGLLGYILRACLARTDRPIQGVSLHHLGHAFAIAAPSQFSPHLFPWKVFDQAIRFITEDLELGLKGMISREMYVRAQIALSRPGVGMLIQPWALRALMGLGATDSVMAGLIRRFSPSIPLYDREDFDSSVFQAVLGSRVLDRGSIPVLTEINSFIASEEGIVIDYDGRRIRLPDALADASPFRLLTVSSAGDRMIPALDAAGVHRVVHGVHHNTEETFGIVSGHVGYLFKPGLYRCVYELIYDFLKG